MSKPISIKLNEEASSALDFLVKTSEYETSMSAVVRSLIIKAATAKGFSLADDDDDDEPDDGLEI
jgi:Arc/MetJ-type ribon-helix-helix transcriptional regulator